MQVFNHKTFLDNVHFQEILPSELYSEIECVCNEINSIFSEIEVDAKITGLKKEGEKLPIFKNSFGAEFDINSLSSGEKQLIIFFANLIFGVNDRKNGIFIVDEPELSLHLTWQKLFIEQTLKINNNIQLIFATHSPEIVGRHRDKMYKLEKVLGE